MCTHTLAWVTFEYVGLHTLDLQIICLYVHAYVCLYDDTMYTCSACIYTCNCACMQLYIFTPAGPPQVCLYIYPSTPIPLIHLLIQMGFIPSCRYWWKGTYICTAYLHRWSSMVLQFTQSLYVCIFIIGVRLTSISQAFWIGTSVQLLYYYCSTCKHTWA